MKARSLMAALAAAAILLSPAASAGDLRSWQNLAAAGDLAMALGKQDEARKIWLESMGAAESEAGKGSGTLDETGRKRFRELVDRLLSVKTFEADEIMGWCAGESSGPTPMFSEHSNFHTRFVKRVLASCEQVLGASDPKTVYVRQLYAVVPPPYATNKP